MTKVYEVVNQILSGMGISYAPIEWGKELSYPYFVGEYEEDSGSAESGRTTGTFKISGWTRKSVSELIEEADRIKGAFWERIEHHAGSLIHFSFSGSSLIPSGESGLHRVVIMINVMEFTEEY